MTDEAAGSSGLWQQICRLPKVELHVHLEGTLEPALAYELAKKNGVDLGFSSLAALKEAWHFDSLPTFLTFYYASMSSLMTEDDFYLLLITYVERVSLDRVIYVEAFFDPQAHMHRGVSADVMMKGLLRAKTQALKAFSIDVQLIPCFLRDESEASAYEAYKQLAPWYAHFIGFGLDSDGFENPPSKFVNIFKQVRQDGFHITLHAELDQKDIHSQIRECVELIGTDRLDHGVNIADEPELIAMAIDHQIGLTVCPLSMQVCNQSLALEKIKHLVDSGIKLCLNSDDPAYFNGYLTQNVKVIFDSGLFSLTDLLGMIRNGFELAWLNDEARQRYLMHFDQCVQTYIHPKNE